MKPPEAPRPFQIQWTADTDRGRVRLNNEDSFLALTFNHQELAYLGKIGEAQTHGWQYIFAVSDGMGGRNAGEFASRIVVQTITELISREFHQRSGDNHPAHLDLMAQFFQTVHKNEYRNRFHQHAVSTWSGPRRSLHYQQITMCQWWC